MTGETKQNDKSSRDGMKIKITESGPYIVTGGVPLSKQKAGVDSEGTPVKWVKVADYPLQETYALCRCGHSQNKPFCDGAHAKAGFTGPETAPRNTHLDRAEKLRGPEIDLTDDESLCVSARFCHRGGGVWNLVEASDDPEAKRVAIEATGNCPSGRLVVWSKQGEAIEPDYAPSIVVVEDPEKDTSGPLWVRGGITIESADGFTYEVRNRVSLCRCGRSGNKPYCDGRHLAG
jgi:CDGSH-type Zn-finger protein